MHLAAVCLLIAAKLHQPLTPSFNQMILLLDEDYRNDPLCKKKMIDLEHRMVFQLQFDVQIQTPLMFAGRFLMFFTRKVTSSTMAKAIEHTAMQFLKFMACKAEYLEFAPSHCGAVASVLTIRMFSYQVAVDLGLARTTWQISKLQKQLLPEPSDDKCPLAIWTPAIEKLTMINRSELTPLYTLLVRTLDQKQFKN